MNLSNRTGFLSFLLALSTLTPSVAEAMVAHTDHPTLDNIDQRISSLTKAFQNLEQESSLESHVNNTTDRETLPKNLHARIVWGNGGGQGIGWGNGGRWRNGGGWLNGGRWRNGSGWRNGWRDGGGFRNFRNW